MIGGCIDGPDGSATVVIKYINFQQLYKDVPDNNKRGNYMRKHGIKTPATGVIPVSSGALLASLIIAGSVNAAGFALIEHSASGMGNAFAGGAAIANDASTVFFNPAGMANLENRQIVGAGHLIFPKAEFSDDASRTSPATGSQPLLGEDDNGGTDAFVPNFYYVDPINEQWTFGIGINAPFGLTVDYDDDWIGRYHAVTSELLTVNINPSLSYKVNSNLAIGFGISAQYADVRLSSATDMASVCLAAEAGSQIPSGTCASVGITGAQQSDGYADLDGDNWGYGFNVGLLYKINNNSRMGIHYRSVIDHTLEGNADFTVPGELQFLTGSGNFVDTGLEAEVTFPDTLSVSYFNQVTPKIGVMLDWSHTRWSEFEELRVNYDSGQEDSVTTENWNNSNRVAMGMTYQLDSQWLLRFGFAIDKTPIPDSRHRTPRLPGETRNWIATGFNYQYRENLSFDFGYAHLFVKDAKINNQFESAVPHVQHILEGNYEGKVDILSAQLNWIF